MSGDQRSGIGEQGFTLLELLIAMGITLAIGGAIAALAPPARIAFERVPSQLELQQRGRTAIEAITQGVRAAGKEVAAANGIGAMADLFPAITLSDPDESGTLFGSLTAIVPVPEPAQGVLESDQASSGAPMTLAIASCPNVKDVCGFTPGVAALILDAAGHFDVFIVESTNPGARRLTPNRQLTRAYTAGSMVVEIDQNMFRLDQQADQSFSLVRVTAAGAVQPIADFLSSLTFKRERNQLEVTLTVEPPPGELTELIPPRQFRTSTWLRNAP